MPALSNSGKLIPLLLDGRDEVCDTLSNRESGRTSKEDGTCLSVVLEAEHEHESKGVDDIRRHLQQRQSSERPLSRWY